MLQNQWRGADSGRLFAVEGFAKSLTSKTAASIYTIPIIARCPAVSQSTSCQQHPGRASHEGDGSNETQAVLRSGVFTVSAIRNPQIAEEKKSLMDGKKSADGSLHLPTCLT
jgi:hypothetical protein